VPDMLAMSCGDSRESGQNRQKGSRRGALSGTSSPVITHERVIGSLRSSMHKETTWMAVASTRSAVRRFAPGSDGLRFVIIRARSRLR
jgi:hypothetical protein